MYISGSRPQGLQRSIYGSGPSCPCFPWPLPLVEGHGTTASLRWHRARSGYLILVAKEAPSPVRGHDTWTDARPVGTRWPALDQRRPVSRCRRGTSRRLARLQQRRLRPGHTARLAGHQYPRRHGRQCSWAPTGSSGTIRQCPARAVPPVHGPPSHEVDPALLISSRHTEYTLKVRWYTRLDEDNCLRGGCSAQRRPTTYQPSRGTAARIARVDSPTATSAAVTAWSDSRPSVRPLPVGAADGRLA